MSDKPAQRSQPQNPLSLGQRIADLRAKKPEYINHGEAVLMQQAAAASLREQFLEGDRSWLTD